MYYCSLLAKVLVKATALTRSSQQPLTSQSAQLLGLLAPPKRVRLG
jgi:hypothetical protein